MSLRLASFAGLALALIVGRSALAQDILTQPRAASAPPAPGKFSAPPCDGDVAVLRLIELTPKGAMAGYLEAVTKNLGWFRAHGYDDDDMVVAKVIVEDPATHRLTYAKNRVVSIHMRPPFLGGSTGHDAGWNVFHDLYQANSNIVTEYNICVPKAQ